MDTHSLEIVELTAATVVGSDQDAGIISTARTNTAIELAERAARRVQAHGDDPQVVRDAFSDLSEAVQILGAENLQLARGLRLSRIGVDE